MFERDDAPEIVLEVSVFQPDRQQTTPGTTAHCMHTPV
jgi:hypothetical protein